MTKNHVKAENLAFKQFICTNKYAVWQEPYKSLCKAIYHYTVPIKFCLFLTLIRRVANNFLLLQLSHLASPTVIYCERVLLDVRMDYYLHH